MLRKDFVLFKSEEMAREVLELREEKNAQFVKDSLLEIERQLKVAAEYNKEAQSALLPIIEYAHSLSQKEHPASFELLVLSSRLQRVPFKLKRLDLPGENSKAHFLEEKSLDSVKVFERERDITSLFHLISSASDSVAIASVRAISKLNNAALLKKACFLGNAQAAFEAITHLEKMKAVNELVEVALEARDSIALKAVEALNKLHSIDGLLSVAMRGKVQMVLLAVHFLEKMEAVSALKALSLLSGEAGKAAYQALIRLKMAGKEVSF